MSLDEALQLAEWRRSVADLYGLWRDASETDAEAATVEWRTARDELFRTHPQSPLPVDERARFGGLSYFPYDPAYRFRAAVDQAEAGPESFESPASSGLPADRLIQLPSSGAEQFSFHLIGHVQLSGPMAGASLPLYWMEGYAGGLFLPLRDGTAGSETYGAGRYLFDSVKGADLGGDPGRRELLLDFNMAYHPSCAYDPRWSCPLAPPESRLSLPIRAGERLR